MTEETKKERSLTTTGGSLPAMTFTPDQIDLVKRTVAKGTTDDELALFLYTAKKTGLDPLVRQIYAVKRTGKSGPQMTIQTGIDGYRLMADRTGKYAGNDDPVYDNEKDPKKATVTVYKMVNGERCGFTATARWDQYYPGDLQGFMWKKMPHLMLGKCAEALALRKAFPAELSGVYVKEEMEQAGGTTTIDAEVVKEEPISRTRPTTTGEIVRIGVSEVTKRDGMTNGKPWTRYSVTDTDGIKYTTFDEKVATVAKNARDNGTFVDVTYTTSEKGKLLKTIEAVPISDGTYGTAKPEEEKATV